MTKPLPSKIIEVFALDSTSPSGLSERSRSGKLIHRGWLEKHGYWRIQYRGQKYWAHRVCYYLYTGTDPFNKEIDHIDGNKANNDPINLRTATVSLNQANQGLCARNTSGHKGVTWNKSRQKWVAQINCAKRYKYLGVFDSLEEASTAYDKAAIEHFLDYAKTNTTMQRPAITHQ
jgi:hypothetical protein